MTQPTRKKPRTENDKARNRGNAEIAAEAGGHASIDVVSAGVHWSTDLIDQVSKPGVLDASSVSSEPLIAEPLSSGFDTGGEIASSAFTTGGGILDGAMDAASSVTSTCGEIAGACLDIAGDALGGLADAL